MRSPAAILAGTAIILAGCHQAKRSETWRKVVAAPHPAPDTGDVTRAYAAELHKTLLHGRVPHKVVTAEFQYHSEYTRHGTARRTVVVYRDQTRRGDGWWLMDERLNKPVWLPDQPLERQISFYLGRPATLVDVSDFMGADRGKIIVLPADKAAPRRSGITSTQPVAPIAPKSAPKTAPVKKAAKPGAETKLAPVEKPAVKPVEKKETKPAGKVESKPAAKPAVTKEASATEKPAEKPKDKKTVEKAPEKKTPASKTAEKPAVKAVEKKEPKPAEKPAEKAPEKKAVEKEPAKPAEKKEKPPVKPAIKAEPSGKPATKPELFDKTDSTPQATIIREEEASAKPRGAGRKPDAIVAESRKPNFLKRFFRRLFRA
jgi:hypothetical protein